MLGLSTGMLAACVWHARSILRPSGIGGPLTFLDPLAFRGGVGVVFLPVVNRPCASLADKEANFSERSDERARITIPICFRLDVVIGQAGEVASPALLACPQEQAYQRPASVRTQQLLQPLGLAMPTQADRDADVVSHAENRPPAFDTR